MSDIFISISGTRANEMSQKFDLIDVALQELGLQSAANREAAMDLTNNNFFSLVGILQCVLDLKKPHSLNQACFDHLIDIIKKIDSQRDDDSVVDGLYELAELGQLDEERLVAFDAPSSSLSFK